MISSMKQSGREATYVNEYVADSLDDLADAPKSPEAKPGSVVFVIQDSSVHMLGNDNEYHEI